MWNNILGHSRQIEQVRRTLGSGHIPNAYLFTGPKGVGKRLVAGTLAAALVCAESKDFDPCGKCQSCRKVSALSHPDIFVIEPEVESFEREQKETPERKSQTSKEEKKKPSEVIKIEQIRDLQSGLKFHPLESNFKLAIIDEADRMTVNTANSLLKILEEPPPSTHFVLISTMPHAVLPTIRSRSQRVEFAPLPDKLIAEYLMRERSVIPADATRIAKLSGGSLGLALSIDAELITQIMGRFANLATRASSADIIEAAEDWSKKNNLKEQRLIFDLLSSFYRDCLRFQVTGDSSDLAHPEAAQRASKISPEKAENAISLISAARRSLDTTANKQLMFEHLLFTLAGQI